MNPSFFCRKRNAYLCTALLLSLILTLLPTATVFAADTTENTSLTEISISMGHPGTKDGSIPSSMQEYVSDNTVITQLPQGVSYDAEYAILTLNNFSNKSCRLHLSFISQSDNENELTLNVIGNNELLDLDIDNNKGNDWLRITGTGSLTAASIQCNRLIMDSGTLNITQSPNYFTFNNTQYYYSLYNFSYGDKDPSGLSSYRFLGGEVNLDCTSNLGNKRVGIDVQSGNVEIRNAKVSIDLGDNAWLGLGVGWTGQKQNGGDLTIENGTLEITSADYQTYFYNLINRGNPLHIFIGKSGPEKEVSFKEAFSEQPFTPEITRYARVSDGKGYLLITSRNEDMPAFLDVPKDEYYAEAVDWAVKNEITNGTGVREFSPNGTCTRGQVVTFLWRAQGSPNPTITNNPFSDITPDDYYYKPVLWAMEEGITTGTGDNSFSPGDPCTRGQVATFLYRAVGSPSISEAVNPFDDVTSNAYYYNSVLWAVKNNVTNGTSPTMFTPDGICTRGQIVTFLFRALK